MSGLLRMGGWIDAFRPAEGNPPQALGAFFRWCLKGSWGQLWFSGLLSAMAGVTELVSAVVLGWLIDAAVNGDSATFFTDNARLMIWAAAFYLIMRPLAYAASSASVQITLGPNLLPLVLSRLHRWTLGQALTFFDNDFAGRIAQKQMQAARAVTDVVTESINTLFFALASVIAAVVYLLAVDLWIGLALGVWLAVYLVLIRVFIPLVRENSAARASSRAMVTGQVVDTITNIKTVKLFAHAAFEDRVALRAMEVFRDRSLEYGVIAAWFRLALMALAGVLPVILIGGTLLLWQDGRATPGAIAAAGAISMRIAQMTGWVSFTLMTIYTSVGEVEDGMHTLAAPHSLADAPGAVALPRVQGEVVFDGVTFAYGRQRGGVADIDLTIRAGEKLGIVAVSYTHLTLPTSDLV